MRALSISWLSLLTLAGPGACIEHHNELGSIDVGGGTVNVGGNGGSAPDGQGGSVSSLVARCNGNAETLSLSRDCSDSSECCTVQDSYLVGLDGAMSSGCTSGVLAMRCSERAGFDQFVTVCPKAVGGCSPDQLRIVTEDGQSASIAVAPAARCEAGVCRSYLP
ncbi:MAG: hypothetical protein QM756_04910 [Polyangiaceae bacterium]